MKIKKEISLAPEFERGQVWRMGEDRLQIELVGKWLIHYRQYNALNKKLPTQFTARGDLEKMLLAHNAVLVRGKAALDMLMRAQPPHRARTLAPKRAACAARRSPRATGRQPACAKKLV